MKKHFSFNKTEKVGVLAMSVLILTLTIVLNVNSYTYLPDPYDVDTSSIEYVSLIKEIEENSKTFVYSEKKNTKKYQLHKFDPNEIDISGWENLGFSNKQAISIDKYRNSFGPFIVKEDLQKPYVIDDKKYVELEPYIVISELTNVKSLIKINVATTDQLQEIRGIGKVYADRLIKYRNLLGGFYQKDQLKEVYGLSQEAITALMDNIEFDVNSIRKINVNSAPKSELKSHPYINFEITASIMKERELIPLENLDFLVNQSLMDIDEVENLKPYIKF